MNLRRMILELLAGKRDHLPDTRASFLLRALQKEASQELDRRQMMEVLWQLLSQGLVFVHYEELPPYALSWILSERGRRVVETEADYEPDDPEGYLKTLRIRIPDLDELVLLYAREALLAYEARCYLASTVMLGVASERAFQLLGESFARWLPGAEAENFRKAFDNPRNNYITKFGEFRKRIEPKKGDIPQEFADNMALNLDSILDLLRINRNEAGHPTGRRVDRDEAYINLQMFARYLQKLYALGAFFLSSKKAP